MMGNIIIPQKNKKRLLVFAVLILISLAAGSVIIIKNTKPVNAQSGCGSYFLCPNTAVSGPLQWDVLNLTASSPAGSAGDDANPRIVSAGTTIRVEMSFRVNSGSTFGSQVLPWINADIGNGCSRPIGPVPPACGQHGGFSNFTRSPAVGTLIDNTNGPSDGYWSYENPIKNNNCPSFYHAAGSHYSTFPPPNNTFQFRENDPYPPVTGIDSVSTCGYQGASVMWFGNMRNPGQTYRYGFDFTINPVTTNEGNICFRANVSVGAASGANVRAQANSIVNNLYARSNQRLCFAVRAAQVSGLVTSSNITATGKPLAGVTIGYSRTCNPATHYDTAITGANGLYYFTTTRGQPFCIVPPVPVTVSGTTYNSVSPTSRSDTCNAASCGGQDFVYTPALVAPNISKSSTPQVARSDGSVWPGEYVDYTVTVTNPYDSNIQNVDIRDYIPLNIISDMGDPNSRYPRILSFQMYNQGGGPPGWNAASFGAYSGNVCPFSSVFPVVFPYGDGSPTLSTNIRCGYQQLGGGNPSNKFLTFDRMPAYSHLEFKWRGWVKPANQVGIYPADYKYCNGAGNYSNQGYLAECIDKSGGLQGATNFAFVRAQNVAAANLSIITYNPIPGDLAVAKNVSTGLNDVDGDGIPEYDPNEPNYNNGDYSIQVTPNGLMGPIEYQVIDQNNGLDDFNANPLHPVISPADSCQPSATTDVVCDSTIKWNFLSWPFNPTPGSFNFEVTFKPSAATPGTTFGNTAKACFHKYWEPGYDILCRVSNEALVERANTNKPYFGVHKGGLRAGGNIKAPSGICPTTEHGGIYANERSYGQYIVGAFGNVNDVDSFIGVKDQGGFQCRPNIIEEVKNYIARGPNYRDNIPNIINSGNETMVNGRGYPAGGPSKVLRPSPTFGDVRISGFTVTRRWTLYVQGDLYIEGDIKNDPNLALLSGHPSLGLVVEGNVYISKDVSNIDALVYASGIINTCSKGPGRSLQNPPNAGYSVAECKERPLKVNGALLGKSIQFARTRNNGGVGTNTEAEIVELVGQAYALPPPGFSSIVGPATSAVSKERRPRF